MTYRLTIENTQIRDRQITLTPAQQHYLLRVLRLKTGDRFIAMNGLGQAWSAEIRETSANIIEPLDIDNELSQSITSIAALPKGSGYEQIVRCCTELGVNNFIPVISDRTILKPSPNKVQRWRKIAAEAAEQSERQIVPYIATPVSWQEALNNTADLSQKFLCVARGDKPSLAKCLQEVSEGEIVIATGCEGGWTEAEIELAISFGYRQVSLGKRILRAVTAPITALAIAGAILEQNNWGTFKLDP
ncbi:16S rRNA (uracil(1498)-N(3))-methyltransferase [Myxosarcina sp. GI1]|uniref:16S rRNA (uracil(1498)-N(3))-methyltransferase n=1 Tax=Myxosarcina sp. GI1 TaxID=1541065 RepID=UPI00055C047E|nr:16S rRNA (uracil(1498)-N(3))-methyltransferase [Myxosarcina sp. GI1]